MQGKDPLRDRTALRWNVSGISKVPIQYQEYFFTPTCLVVDHIFCRHEYESQFVAVLGKDFLQEDFLRAQWTEGGYTLDLPIRPSQDLEELVVFTNGCCLSNGQTKENPACAGYGIHFPQHGNDWDISNILPETEKSTNQCAELIAVIRALELIRARGVPCQRIQICTDSMYAVQGLNNWIPVWRENGYRTAQKKPVANADLFKDLDQIVADFMDKGFAIRLEHVPREMNQVADRLAKAGAQGPPGTHQFVMKEKAESKGPVGIIGRGLQDDINPLVQWTPNGSYWVKGSLQDLKDVHFEPAP